MRRNYKSISGGGVLPAGYAECEYIESTGTQYINTLVKADNNTGMKFGMSNLVDDSRDFNFIGCRIGGGDRFMVNSYNYSRITCGFGQWHDDINCLVNPRTDEKVTFSLNYLNERKFIAEGTVYANIATLNRQIGDICVFGQNIINNSVSSVSPFIYKIYDINISNMEEDVRMFIPALRLSDNKPGLYDLCESICPLTGTPFYVNAGSGEFLYKLKS